MGFLRCATVLLLLLIVIANASVVKKQRYCDVFSGRWLIEQSYPLYDASTCPFIEKEFRCEKNGRPDLLFTYYSWKPLRCDLQRFDGEKFLKRYRGKSIMFVGDSLSRNQWNSLACMLHSSLPNASYNITRLDDVSTITFADYQVKVMLDRNVYLVDIVRENIGRVLKLDSIQGRQLWKGIDMLIFNTWHWWNRRAPTQPWDYIEVEGVIRKDMDRMAAFQRALTTWGQWVDTNIDPAKTLVFFQGISPSHYNGSLWSEHSAKNCEGQQQPVEGSTYPGGLPPAMEVLKTALSKIKKPVTLLDITLLSLLRKDGHPSIYGLPGLDCITGVFLVFLIPGIKFFTISSYNIMYRKNTTAIINIRSDFKVGIESNQQISILVCSK